MNKICTTCNEVKGLSDFSSQKGGKFGVNSRCKSCGRDARKKKYHANLVASREYQRKYNSNWVKNNHERHLISKRKWEQKNHSKKYGVDINYTMKERLRALTRQSLRGYGKQSKTAQLLGCSFDDFINYFQSKFVTGMKWDDVLSGKIHIDHIKPCSKFDLSKIEEQQRCFHYTNLQPLWAEDNLSKSNNY